MSNSNESKLPTIKIETGDNSNYSPVAHQLSEKDNFKDDKLVSLYNGKINKLVIYEQTKSEKSQDQARDVIFKSEIPRYENFQFSQSKEALKFPAKYLIDNVKSNDNTIFQDFSNYYVNPPEKVLQLTQKESSSEGIKEFIEPILYTAFLVVGNEIVSDPWFFSSPLSKPFFEKANINLNTNSKASFILKTNPEQTYLFVIANRVLQVNEGSPVTQFYTKQQPKIEKLARSSVELAFPRCNDIWNPFAFTFATVSEIAQPIHTGFSFPQLFIRRSFFKPQEIPDLIKKGRNKSYEQIPITITLSAEIKEIPQPQNLMQNGVSLIYPIMQNDKIDRPFFNFRNQLRVKIISAILKLPSKVKGRNIVCKLSMQNGKLSEKGLISLDRYGNANVESATTVCHYHETKPFINDTFIFDLPYSLDKSASIRIELFHGIAQKSKDKWSTIGWCEVPFFNQNGVFFIEGSHDVPVIYDGYKSGSIPLEDNHLTVECNMESTLFSSDKNLYEFLMKGRENKIDSTYLKEVDPHLLLENLASIVDICVRTVPSSANQSVLSLIHLSNVVQPLFSDFSAFMNTFAKLYAFRETNINENYPLELINAYKSFLDVQDVSKTRQDLPIVDFLFLIISKSIQISKANNLLEPLKAFGKSFAVSVFNTLKIGLIQAKQLMKSYAKFINLIGSIGLVQEASTLVDITLTCHDEFKSNQSADDIVIHFLKNTWNPSFFYESIIQCDVTSQTVVKAIAIAKSNNMSLPIQGIYNVLLRNVSTYSEDENTKVAFKLVKTLDILCPASELPFADNSEVHHALVFLVFILSHIQKQDFPEWWKSNQNKQALFDSIHFLLEKVSLSHLSSVVNSNENSKKASLVALEQAYQNKPKEKRNFRKKLMPAIQQDQSNSSIESTKNELSKQTKIIICASHFALANILDILITCVDESMIGDVCYAIYHLLCTDIATDAIPHVVNLVCHLLEERTDEAFSKAKPPLPRFIARAMELCIVYPESFNIVNKLFDVDEQKAGNTNRAKCVCSRSLSCLRTQIDPKEYTDSDNPRSQLVQDGKWYIQLIQQINNLQFEGIEQIGDSLYQKAILLKHSPDAMFEALGELIKHHHETEYFAEEIQVRMMRCALIAENLTKTGRINNIWDEKEHAANAFKKLCQNYSDVIPPFANSLNVVSFCDSKPFTLTGFIKEVIDVMNVATEAGYYEPALSISEFAVALLEANDMYSAASQILQLSREASHKLSEIKPGVDRLFGYYYRIKFFGKPWGEDDGKCYIYREKQLTKIYTVMGRIRDEYTKKFGFCEAIMESGPVDLKKLDLSKAYFQPTSVEPLFRKKELLNRKTSYERNDHLTEFFLDAPFTKTGKTQGSVESQWLRRTIIKPAVPLPCATKRVLVTDESTVDYEPIRVSCRQLSQRINQLKIAIQNQESQTVQQLLSGSLMVQVNEGPSRMAEVFLGDESKSHGKYEEKLRGLFEEFLAANEEGLKYHANYVIANPTYTMMQHEMEAGLEALRDKLSKFTKKKKH